MTLIENDSPKVQYTGPFIKGQLLPLTFPYIATEDVKMIIDDKPAIFNVDYEIITEPNDEHPVAYPNSAYIKSDLPNAKQITLYRVTPLDQQAPFPQQSKFRSERVEQALDKLTMQQQEQEEQLSRCIIAPITLETFNGQLPTPAADQALKWNADGTELENYDIIGEQEAFETDVNTRFSEFRNEINENLEAVLNAADKLDTLEQQVQAATDAANTALTSATKADEYAEEAFMSADQAEGALEEIKQVIQDAENTIDEIMQNCGLPMFAPFWSDHLYNDASFLRADNFSWHSADIYVTAYEEILKQYNNPEATEQTDGDIIYKLSPDGFRIALASEHDKVLERYLAGEKAWFYILDTENQRFKLPREKKTDGKYLYFYVGTYERPEAEVNLGTVTDALNNKVDLDGGNYAGSGLEAVVKKNGGSGLELCDIGMALYVDETKGLRRYLNGQIVEINSNTQAFLNRLQEITTLHPSLLCTEEEWQAEKEASDYGQVGKFVFNYAEDEKTVESVRLPAVVNVQGLLDLQNLGMTVEAGLPNIKSKNIGFVRSGSSIDGGGAIKVTSKGQYAEGASVNQGWSGTFALNAADSSSYYKDGATVQSEAIQYPYYIQIATGQETEVNIRNDIESIVPYTLFDSKYSEAKQYNASWVLGGSTLSKSVYPTAYEAALVEYNSEIADGTTVELPSGGSYTKRGVSGGVTVKLSTDETVTEYDWKLDTVAEILTVPTLNGSEDLLSDRYDDLELKASGSTYTAPANGWFWIQKLSSSTAQYLTPTIKDSNGNIKYTLTSQPTSVGYDAEILAPVSKGDVISISYSVGGATKSFRFIYAKSNGSLYFLVASVAQNAPLANLGRIEEQLAQRKVVVETYKNGNSWYRVWSDGWCEQGGVFDRGSDITTGGSVGISLVHPFKDTHYTLMVNNGGNSTGNGFGWYVESNIMTARALSEFYVYTWRREISNRYISWYACGY